MESTIKTPVQRTKWSLSLHIDTLRGVQLCAKDCEPSSYFVGNIHVSEVVTAIDNALDALEQAEARADSLYNKLQIASLKAKQDELAILKEKERAARAKLELERAEAENVRLTAELAPIKAVHAIMQTARKAMEANSHE